MYLCVDESWQDVAGTRVASLGGVAIPSDDFTDFLRAFESIKQQFLRYAQLTDSELKGSRCFGETCFRGAAAVAGTDHWLNAAAAVIAEARRRGYATFCVATSDPRYVDLRSPNSVDLLRPYALMLAHLRHYVRADQAGAANSEPGMLLFDLRTQSEDRAIGRAVQNYLARNKRRWRRDLTQIPEFTISATHPGLQLADLIAYLGAWQYAARQELDPYAKPLRELAFDYRPTPLQSVRSSWEWL